MEKREIPNTRTLRRSIKKDRVNPSDFLNLEIIYCCEQCSYFNNINESCVLGFSTVHHLKEEQLKTFKVTGYMAFCRFLEID